MTTDALKESDNEPMDMKFQNGLVEQPRKLPFLSSLPQAAHWHVVNTIFGIPRFGGLSWATKNLNRLVSDCCEIAGDMDDGDCCNRGAFIKAADNALRGVLSALATELHEASPLAQVTSVFDWWGYNPSKAPSGYSVVDSHQDNVSKILEHIILGTRNGVRYDSDSGLSNLAHAAARILLAIEVELTDVNRQRANANPNNLHS